MAQIFHRSANTFARVSIFGAAFIVVGLLAVVGVYVRSPYATGVGVAPPQPVAFSHKHHVGDEGFDCRYCHTSVEASSFAGMPPTETCMHCHSQILTNTDALAPVIASSQNNTPIEWTRVYQLADFVFFNHSIHVNKGIGCTTCHGQINQMPLTEKATSLQMTWCLDCHRNPAQYVRPFDQVFSVTWAPPPNQLQVGAALVKQYHIQSLTNCWTCHR